MAYSFGWHTMQLMSTSQHHPFFIGAWTNWSAPFFARENTLTTLSAVVAAVDGEMHAVQEADARWRGTFQPTALAMTAQYLRQVVRDAAPIHADGVIPNPDNDFV
jgi:hypothetical protein